MLLVGILFMTSCKRSSAPNQTFWQWFAENAESLRKDDDMVRTMNRITHQLKSSHDGVIAEIGRDGEAFTLVLSADGIKEYFPAVQELYATRPTVPGWNIVAFRQRSEPAPLEMNGKKISPDQLKFSSERQGAKLAIKVWVPGFTSDDDMGQLLYLVLDHTIGEYDMETRIGGIELAPLESAPADARALTELPALLDQTFPTR